MSEIVRSKAPAFEGIQLGDTVRLRSFLVERGYAPECITGKVVTLFDGGVAVRHTDGSGPFNWSNREVYVIARGNVDRENQPEPSEDDEETVEVQA